MKRIYLPLAVAAVAGLWLGRGQAQEVVVNAQAAQGANSAVQVTVGGATGTHHGHGGADCAPACAVKKTCVVVPDVKKTSKTVYSCKAKDFCLPKTLGGCCCAQGCEQAGCESCVRTKRVLLKKVVTTECPSFKCEVAEQACAAPCVSGVCAAKGGACCVGRPFGCCVKGQQACDPVAPAAPVPVTPDKKMPDAGKGLVAAPVAPTTTVIAPAQPSAGTGIAFPQVQPLPSADPR